MDACTRTVSEAIAPTGRLRAAINLGNPVLAQRDASTGALQGVSVDLATELGRRLDLPLELVPFDGAGQVFGAAGPGAAGPGAAGPGAWDIAFLAIDPLRAERLSFTAPYVVIEGTYVVRDDAPFRHVPELDREGVRIAVGAGAAYELYLARSLKHAELVRAPTSAGALELFLAAGLDAAAGVKQPLVRFARSHAGLRVIEGRFTTIEQAMAIPQERLACLSYLRCFVEELKANGFIASALARSGQGDAAAASPAPTE